MKRYLRDLRASVRTLFSHEFLHALRDYYSPKAIAGRLDALAARLAGPGLATPTEPTEETRQAFIEDLAGLPRGRRAEIFGPGGADPKETRE